MNRPPQESKRISETRLRDFAGACFKAAGLRGDHAEQLAQLLTNGDLRGVHSHGLRQVPGYCESLRDGLINPNPNCQVLKETPTAVLVDGDGGLGYAPMMMATESAIDQAQRRTVWLLAQPVISVTTVRQGTTSVGQWRRGVLPSPFKAVPVSLVQQTPTIGLLPPIGVILRSALACPVGTNRRLSLTWQPASSPITSAAKNLMPCRK